MSFPRYPAYKPSGVEWLGEVPEHWNRTALKFLGEYQNGYPFKPDDRGEEGLPIIRISQLTGDNEPAYYSGDLDERVKVRDGDLLFTWSATIDAFIWEKGEAWLNQHIFRVSPSTESDKRYLYYVIKHVAPKLADFDAHGSTMRHIKKESLGEKVYVPSVREQALIATFLDRETAKIEALITEQQRLIELLQEKRQAVISHAVTKGLNPNVPMKDSGVEWLGEVPEHWEVKLLKHLATVQTGMAKGKDLEGVETVEVPYLRVANVQDGYLDLEEVYHLTVPIASIDRYSLKKGDVLMNEGGDFDKLGRGCIWTGEIEPCVHQNHVFAVRPHSISGQWLNTYTSSKAANSYFIGKSKQSTNLASISSTNLMGLLVPVPPSEEATEILGHMNERVQKIDTLKLSATHAVVLLQERRSALISAAVTGQIDVRGLVEAEGSEL